MYIDLKVFVSKSEIFVRFSFSQCMNKQTKYKKSTNWFHSYLEATRKETIHYGCFFFFLVKQSLKTMSQNTKKYVCIQCTITDYIWEASTSVWSKNIPAKVYLSNNSKAVIIYTQSNKKRT